MLFTTDLFLGRISLSRRWGKKGLKDRVVLGNEGRGRVRGGGGLHDKLCKFLSKRVCNCVNCVGN